MTLKETKEFMERIKTYYPNFMIDDFTVKEWNSQLKDYSYQDISEKFSEHLKSEEYGNYVPRINFLTKYLTKEKEKGNNNADKIYTNCNLCGKSLLLSEYETHFHKCSSIGYVMKQYKKYKGKDLNREKLENASEEMLDKFYNEILQMVYDDSNTSKDEKHCIDMIWGFELND